MGLGLELVGNPDSYRNEMYDLIRELLGVFFEAATILMAEPNPTCKPLSFTVKALADLIEQSGLGVDDKMDALKFLQHHQDTKAVAKDEKSSPGKGSPAKGKTPANKSNGDVSSTDPAAADPAAAEPDAPAATADADSAAAEPPAAAESATSAAPAAADVSQPPAAEASPPAAPAGEAAAAEAAAAETVAPAPVVEERTKPYELIIEIVDEAAGEITVHIK